MPIFCDEQATYGYILISSEIGRRRAEDSCSSRVPPVDMETLLLLLSSARLRRISEDMRISFQRVHIAEYLVRPACGSDMRISGAADIFCGLVNPYPSTVSTRNMKKETSLTPFKSALKIIIFEFNEYSKFNLKFVA